MLNINKDLLIISIVTVITVIAWVGFEAYRSATNKAAPTATQQLAAPFTPTIRSDVLQQLNQDQP